MKNIHAKKKEKNLPVYSSILFCTCVMGEWCPGQSSQGQGKDIVFPRVCESVRGFLCPKGTWLLIVCVYGLFPHPCERIYEFHAACRDKHFSSPYLTSREGNLCGAFCVYCLLADEIYSSLEIY